MGESLPRAIEIEPDKYTMVSMPVVFVVSIHKPELISHTGETYTLQMPRK